MDDTKLTLFGSCLRLLTVVWVSSRTKVHRKMEDVLSVFLPKYWKTVKNAVEQSRKKITYDIVYKVAIPIGNVLFNFK